MMVILTRYDIMLQFITACSCQRQRNSLPEFSFCQVAGMSLMPQMTMIQQPRTVGAVRRPRRRLVD